MRQTVLSRLWGFVKPYSLQAILAVLSGLATILSSIGLMATAAWLIASAALQPSIAELQVAIVAVRFFGLSRGVFRYLERLLTHTVTLNILARLRSWAYERLEALAPAGLTYARSGDLLSLVVSHIETLENVYARVVLPTLVALIISLGTALTLWFIHPALGQAAAAGLLLGGVLLPFVARRLSRPNESRLVDQNTRLHAILIDSIQGSTDLVVNNRAESQLRMFMGYEKEYSRMQVKSAWVRGLNNGWSILFSNGTMLAILIVSIGLAASSRLPALYLGVLALGTLASFEAIQPLAAAYQALENSLAAARRLFEIVDRAPTTVEPERPQPIPEITGQRGDELITIRNLTFTYPGEAQPVLDGLDLTIDQGECVALVGASGCGKTTLVNLLLRFWEYSSGEVRLLGHDLRSYSPDALRRWMGVLSQPPILFYASLLENLKMGNPQASRDQIERAAKTADIHEFICTLPQGYETLVGERGLNLSAGQRQRIALARLLVRETPFIILDEPTANLDLNHARRILHNLSANVFTKRTVLVITHDLSFLQGMDRIYLLRQGRIAESGRHADLINKQGFYWKMNQ